MLGNVSRKKKLIQVFIERELIRYFKVNETRFLQIYPILLKNYSYVGAYISIPNLIN